MKSELYYLMQVAIVAKTNITKINRTIICN